MSKARIQLSLDPEMHRRARRQPDELGVSFGNYLGRSDRSDRSDVAANEGAMIAEALAAKAR